MEDVTLVDEKKYKRMKRTIIVSSIVAGVAFALALCILSLYIPAVQRI